MSPHAPGPWRKVQTRVQAGNRTSGNAEIVALCGGHEAAEANARLIAAAPDLLEALKQLVRQIEINDFTDSHGHAAKKLQAFSEARASIKKATAQ